MFHGHDDDSSREAHDARHFAREATRHAIRAARAHRRDPFGPGFGAGYAHGFGPHAWWRGALFGRGPRARRGDVRSAILALLAEEPMHGYQIISELEARSGGRWRPSAGSVYPTLQQLEDEGLVRAEEREGRRVFTLTDEGQKVVAGAGPRTEAPWELDAEDDPASLRDLFIQVAAATMQVSRVGSPALTAEARTILTETRRSLYRLLAEDDRAPGDRPTGKANSAEKAEPTEPAET